MVLGAHAASAQQQDRKQGRGQNQQPPEQALDRAEAVFQLRHRLVNAEAESLEGEADALEESVESELIRSAVDFKNADLPAARRHLDRAVELAESVPELTARSVSSQVAAQARVERARVLSSQGDYMEALNDLLKAKTAYVGGSPSSNSALPTDAPSTLASADAGEKPHALADIELMLCSTHGVIENLDAANSACTRALQIVDTLDDDFLKLRALNSRAVLGMRGEDYAAAERDYLQALDVARTQSNGFSEVHILGNLSTAARHLGKGDEAVEFATLAVAAAEDMDAPGIAALQRIILADALLYSGRVSEAADTVGAAMGTLPSPRHRQYALEVASAIASAQGDHRRAQELRIQARSLQRDIAGDRRASESLRLQEEYDVRERESDILALQQESALVSAERDRLRAAVAATLALLALALTSAYALRKRRLLEAEVSRERAVFATRLDERTRMAREIHDTLMQGYTAIGFKLDSAIGELPSTAEAARKLLADSLRMVDHSIADARTIIGRARSSNTESLSEVLREILARHGAENGGVDIVMRSGAPEPSDHHHDVTAATASSQPLGVSHLQTLDPPLSLELSSETCRVAALVVNEAVTNAVKHADPQTVEVCADIVGDELVITVSDDGTGFDPEGEYPGHYGLVGMRERLNNAGGRLDIASRAGLTTLTMRLPVKAERNS